MCGAGIAGVCVIIMHLASLFHAILPMPAKKLMHKSGNKVRRRDEPAKKLNILYLHRELFTTIKWKTKKKSYKKWI